MNTAEKVAALLRFYSVRYNLSATDWLEGLIEMENSPRGGDHNRLIKRLPPYVCEHCGTRTQYGMGARRHHTDRHVSCTEQHDMRKRVEDDGS